MNQLTNHNHKIDFLTLNDTSSFQLTQTIVKSKYKKEKCNECNKRRSRDETHQICHIYTCQLKLEFVHYEQFKNIEFIVEGGFSKIYKATWVVGPINWDNIERKSDNISRKPNYTVVLKKINDSKNITSKELNELKIYYDFYTNWNSQHNNYQVKRRSNKISYQETPLNSYICNYFETNEEQNSKNQNPTKIIESSDIGLVPKNNPGAIGL
ncbi:unnamed protein product [Rhizophagus irregularis]|nr:unnamed protein product [Rhizophagus irregularis]